MRLALVLTVCLLAASSAAAGPREAARLLENARGQGAAPWPERVAAYRRAIAATVPTDRTYVRALKAVAVLLEKEGWIHGALGFRARAAALGPERDESRLGRVLSLGLLLRREGDLEGARQSLETVLRLGRNTAPDKASRALVALAEDARDGKKPERLEVLYAAAHHVRLSPSSRLRVLDAVGVGRIAAGDAPGAEQILREAERAWRDALRNDDAKEASRVARLWLDLELRQRLEALQQN